MRQQHQRRRLVASPVWQIGVAAILVVLAAGITGRSKKPVV